MSESEEVKNELSGDAREAVERAGEILNRTPEDLVVHAAVQIAFGEMCYERGAEKNDGTVMPEAMQYFAHAQTYLALADWVERHPRGMAESDDLPPHPAND